MPRRPRPSCETMRPVTPSSITSGTEPWRKASTGVPQAMASIITRPKGSGQSIGNSSARASPRNLVLPRSSTSPTNSTPPPSSSKGWITVSKYFSSALSTLAAIFSGMPSARAISMARSGRFSAEIRPRNAR